MKPVVIIHGWSDEAESFLPLADEISKQTGRPVKDLWLGHYVSMDDQVRIADLVSALGRAWSEAGLPLSPRAVDVIVHSTGGLIIRDWIYSRFASSGKTAPVNNLVMLAPANFGSPLAHKGRAVYGRIFKGFNSKKIFETGTHILKALEMASPYACELASADRIGKTVYSPSGIRVTVIVGNQGYGGIAAIANEKGSDGTVYVASANLNCDAIELKFPSSPAVPKMRKMQRSKGETAFLVMDGQNHSTIALKDPDHEGYKSVRDKIVSALEIRSSSEFKEWIAACSSHTRKVMKKNSGKDDAHKHEFQNTIIHVHDDHGYDVTDYVIEFYKDVDMGAWDRFAELFNENIISKVHAYKGNESYKSFMVNCTRLRQLVDEEGEALRISISAMPDINNPKTLAGYKTFEDEDIGALELGPKDIREFFVANRTLFVDIELTRMQKEEIFTLGNKDQFDN